MSEIGIGINYVGCDICYNLYKPEDPNEKISLCDTCKKMIRGRENYDNLMNSKLNYIIERVSKIENQIKLFREDFHHFCRKKTRDDGNVLNL